MIEGKTLHADGYDAALIGHTDQGVAVYSKSAMVAVLLQEDDMTTEDALEWLEFNVWCAYVGEFTPIYVNDLENINEE
jgi:hypothetical protein